MRRGLLSMLLGLAACAVSTSTADGADISDEMPEELPAGECRDTEGCDAATSTGSMDTTGSSSGTAEPGCVASEDCDGAGACVAAWDGEARGAFECRFACIPTLDETSWCSDDDSCCDADAVCTPRGYCVLDVDAEMATSTGA